MAMRAVQTERTYIRQLFPEIELISDPNLARAVENIWLKAWKASKWERIEDAWFSPEAPGYTLVNHVRVCTKGALAMADIITEIHGLKFDRDQLLALGLLHDASKIAEYEPSPDGRAVVSEMGKKISHAIFSGVWAAEEGLPLDMLHLIWTHSNSSKMLPQLAEGVLFAHVDHADADSLYFSSGSGKRLIKR